METEITERGVSCRFRRVTEAVPAARAFVRRWLPASGPADELVSAAAEALNNVIDHATGEHFTITVRLDGTTGVVTVSDSGPGFRPPGRPTMPAPDAARRLGLAMMHLLADRVDVISTATGTTVALARALDRAPASRESGYAATAVA